MFCDRCGANANDSAAFCSGCGKPFGSVLTAARPAQAASPQNRISKHLQIVAILWFVIAAFRVIPGIALIAIFSRDSFPPDVPPFVHPLLSAIGVLFLAGGALGIVTGLGLLTRQPWARMLAIVSSALSLADIPFGTALGAYTLWVLLPAESEQEYRRLSSALSRM